MKMTSYRNVHITSTEAYLNVGTITQGIAKCKSIDDYAYILHDKDRYTAKEAAEKGHPELEGKLKTPHYHLVIHFKSPVPVSNIANTFGIAPNFIGNVNRSLDGAYEYLVHCNDPDKYQYSPSEVTASFDYAAFMEKAPARRAKKERKASRQAEMALVCQYVEELATGAMREYAIPEIIPPDLYAKYKPRFDRAVDYHLMSLTSGGNDRQMDVIYICGGSGSGKTTYAKLYAQSKGFHYYLAGGGRDPFDSYRGEECVILDDLRGDVFPFHELLNLLDNHSLAPVSSRYHNKVLEASLMIVTSIMTLEEFYHVASAGKKEPFIQLQRRCRTYIKFSSDVVQVYKFDFDRYHLIHTLENPIRGLYPKDTAQQMTPEELAAEAAAYSLAGAVKPVGNAAQEGPEGGRQQSQ